MKKITFQIKKLLPVVPECCIINCGISILEKSWKIAIKIPLPFRFKQYDIVTRKEQWGNLTFIYIQKKFIKIVWVPDYLL